MDQPIQSDTSFPRQLIGAFRYPFQGDGSYILLIGAAFFCAADFVSSHASIFGILIELAVLGFLFAFAKDVVRTSALGEDKPPGWTDFSDWVDDLLLPAVEFLVVLAVTFGPFIVLQFKHPESVGETLALKLAALAWGCVLFPILFLAVAVVDSLQAILNPIPLIRAVWLTLRDYSLVVLFFVGVLALATGFNWLLDYLHAVPILPNLLDRLVAIYLLAVLMRSFGLLYRQHHETLLWY